MSDWRSTTEPWTGRQILTVSLLCLVIGFLIGALVW